MSHCMTNLPAPKPTVCALELEKNMGTHDDSWFLAASVDLYFPKFKGNNGNNASSLKSKHGNTETKRSTPPAKKAQKWMDFFLH